MEDIPATEGVLCCANVRAGSQELAHTLLIAIRCTASVLRQKSITLILGADDQHVEQLLAELRVRCWPAEPHNASVHRAAAADILQER